MTDVMDPVKKPVSAPALATNVAGYKQHYRYVEDEEAMADFFKNFRDVEGLYYMKQVEAIKARRRDTFELRLDDMLHDTGKHSTHERMVGLAHRIETSTSSYIEHLSRVVDRLVAAAPAAGAEEVRRDTFDFLEQKDRQRMEQRGADAVSDIPPLLLRRYRVVLVPSGENAEKRQVRQMGAARMGKLTVLSGMCVAASPVKPKVVVATYICDQCNECIYQEVVGMKYHPVTQCPSDVCKANNSRGRLFLEHRATRFVEHQELRLQELPQHVPKGCVPRSLKVVIEGSLCGNVSPGSVVDVTGVFLPDPKAKAASLHSVATRTYFKGLNVALQKKAYADILTHDAADKVHFVRNTMDDQAMVEKLVRSVAPEIYGMDDVKKILACQLVGGLSLSRGDGLKLRGDLNICLMGDPGVAKSQLLRWTSNLCPRSVFTTGKGSSGVGLTASVTIDEHTREACLEGGALVISDKGICCIDEFDKMDEGDRTAIHEVMEQQTVNIAKGGIITTLNARTAILAAANPRFGRWKSRKTPTENINLPASLLSRFDVLWLLLDRPDDERDRLLSRHVTSVHMGEVGEQVSANYGLRPSDPMFDKAFLRQFISHAKQLQPVLSDSVVEVVQNLYCELRANETGTDATTYTTPRTLLAILRLSQALTRLRLGEVVTEDDVKEASRLMRCSKESILTSQIEGTRQREGPLAQIFNLLRSVCRNQEPDESGQIITELGLVKAAMARKMLTEEHLEQCLRSYETAGVWEVVRSGKAPVSVRWL